MTSNGLHLRHGAQRLLRAGQSHPIAKTNKARQLRRSRISTAPIDPESRVRASASDNLELRAAAHASNGVRVTFQHLREPPVLGSPDVDPPVLGPRDYVLGVRGEARVQVGPVAVRVPSEHLERSPRPFASSQSCPRQAAANPTAYRRRGSNRTYGPRSLRSTTLGRGCKHRPGRG